MNKKYENVDEIALLFQRLFATEDGKDVLSILKRMYHDPAIVPNAAVDGAALTKLTDLRIGEFNVYRYINSMVTREIGKGKGE